MLPARDKETTLDVFVEAMGRVNYGSALKDFKGIVGGAYLATGDQKQELTGWDVFSLPLDEERTGGLEVRRAAGRDDRRTGVLSRHVPPRSTGDTFLDMRTWGKGVAWINGHALGRFWNIGPTQTMYVPVRG